MGGKIYTITQGGTGTRVGQVKGDLDGDGYPDVVWQNQKTGEVGAWLMTGTTANDYQVTIPGQSDPNWKIVGIADFNADYDPDILWQHQSSGAIGIWYMHGMALASYTTFTPAWAPDPDWKIVGVGDFNADGKPDLVWQHQSSGSIGVWFMNGVARLSYTTFTPAWAADPNWKIVGVGDFNADGKPDLVWQHQSSGSIGVWFMNGVARLSYTTFTPAWAADPNWKIVGAGDFNADGKPDLVWQHQSSGSIGVWFMNGVARLSYTTFTPAWAADPNWKIVGPN